MMDKQQLRTFYKIKREYFQHSAREVADGAIRDAFFAALGSYESFFVYRSFGSEADTSAVISRLLAEGKRVFLPRVEGKEMTAVPYFGEEMPLIKSRLGVYEPTGQAYGGEIDVAVVPLLAVNGEGYRLGYGGGYYDRFLSKKKCLKAGLGYSFQMTDRFIQDGWDVPLDLYVSERGIFCFGK